MALLRNIEWKDNSNNIIVYKMSLGKDYVTKGSKLTVRESQSVVFCDKGRMADVFLPGFYSLDTDNVPILTKMMSWKYGFESPFKSDIFFVNTKQFTNQKWGTVNPIIIRDADYGAVRVRGYGTYAFRVSDPYVFLTELSGTNSTYRTQDITDYIRSILISGISDAIGECKIPILDMAGNLRELGDIVRKNLEETFNKIGIEISGFNFENFSMPEELEKALDQSTSLGILGKNMNVYMQKAQADALLNASQNQGAGGTIGAGMGMGMGLGMGSMFGNAFNNMGGSGTSSNSNMINCAKCGANMRAEAKFCPECGTPNGAKCPKCGTVVKANAKFCPECGASLSSKCPECNADVKPGAKFCPECGKKL